MGFIFSFLCKVLLFSIILLSVHLCNVVLFFLSLRLSTVLQKLSGDQNTNETHEVSFAEIKPQMAL